MPTANHIAEEEEIRYSTASPSAGPSFTLHSHIHILSADISIHHQPPPSPISSGRQNAHLSLPIKLTQLRSNETEIMIYLVTQAKKLLF